MSDQGSGSGRDLTGTSETGSGSPSPGRGQSSWFDVQQHLPVILITLVVGYFIYDASNDNGVASRLGQIDGRIEVIGNRIDGIEGRFVSIEQGIERGKKDALERLDLADRTIEQAMNTAALTERQINHLWERIDRDVKQFTDASTNLANQVELLGNEVAKLKEETEKRGVLQKFFRDDRNRGTLFMLISLREGDADSFPDPDAATGILEVSYMIDGRYLHDLNFIDDWKKECIYWRQLLFGLSATFTIPCLGNNEKIRHFFQEHGRVEQGEASRYYLVNAKTGEIALRF
mgnify:CR=1 FL=1